ncbi:YtxH domain-containing protein [Ferdinandcohnia sp. Marseille-Q9671]
MGKNNGSSTFILGTIIGAAVGAATALFLAPKTGQELRQQINDQASVVKEKTNTLSKTFSEQSNQILTKVKDLKVPTQKEFIGQQENEDQVRNATTESTVSENESNEKLFQEKLAEAQQALTDAEKNTQTNQ